MLAIQVTISGTTTTYITEATQDELEEMAYGYLEKYNVDSGDLPVLDAAFFFEDDYTREERWPDAPAPTESFNDFAGQPLDEADLIIVEG